MPEWLTNINWEFWAGDIGVPIALFIIGLFTGKAWEKKANAKVKGNNNTVIQNSDIKK